MGLWTTTPPLQTEARSSAPHPATRTSWPRSRTKRTRKTRTPFEGLGSKTSTELTGLPRSCAPGSRPWWAALEAEVGARRRTRLVGGSAAPLARSARCPVKLLFCPRPSPPPHHRLRPTHAAPRSAEAVRRPPSLPSSAVLDSASGARARRTPRRGLRTAPPRCGVRARVAPHTAPNAEDARWAGARALLPGRRVREAGRAA